MTEEEEVLGTSGIDMEEAWKKSKDFKLEPTRTPITPAKRKEYKRKRDSVTVIPKDIKKRDILKDVPKGELLSLLHNTSISGDNITIRNTVRKSPKSFFPYIFGVYYIYHMKFTGKVNDPSQGDMHLEKKEVCLWADWLKLKTKVFSQFKNKTI